MIRPSSRPTDQLTVGSRSAPRRRAVLASRSRLVALLAACILLGGALPAHATHFRYGTIDWVPAQAPARTIVFDLADAFRRAPTVNETSLDHCVDITAANFATASLATCPHSPGDGYPGVGDVVREDIGGTQFYFGDCTANSDCGSGGACTANQCTAGSTPGGRHVPTGSTPMFYVVTSIDVPNNWMYVQGLDPSTFGTAGAVIDTTISHTYPGTTATFTAGLDDGNRISLNDPPNAHINNPDYTYLVQTIVDVSGTFAGNSSPVSTQVPIVNCPISTDAPCPPGIGATCSFVVPAVDPNGDTLFFRMATPAEASRTSGFTQPGPPDSTFAAAIDSSTGMYTWNTCGATLSAAKACAGGTNNGTSCTTNATCTGGGTCTLLTSLYSTQVIVEDRSSATVKSHIPVDFLIQLVPQVVNNHPPVFDHPPTPVCGSTQTVLAGDNVSFSVEASDPDAGDAVTLNVAGLPSGATMTPSLPTTGNPVSSAFSWTPTAANVGDFIVNFSATDKNNVQVTCPITIEVQCNVALCDDGNVCTTDACSAPLGVCQHTNNTATCDDGNSCTTGDTCSQGSCAGTPVVCSNGDQCNDPGTCDAATGQCSPPVPHGGSCSDGSSCTTGDTCQAGSCVGTPVVCSNGDQCNGPGSCDAATGQCSPPVPHSGESCSDGNACTTGDTCQAGSCVGTPVVCTALDQCHEAGTCDPASGQCSNPDAPDGTICSDGNDCSTGDQCIAGVCQGSMNGCEICDDQIDNNGDGLIDCLDPQCPACPPIVDTCHHPCVSQIIFKPRGLDLLRLQASFKPVTSADPATEQFGVLITNAGGVVFAGLLPPGTVRKTGKTFTGDFKAAKTVGGIYKVKIIPLPDGTYRINLKGYAQMFAKANTPAMQVQVLIGNDVSLSETIWSQIKVGWRAQLP